MTPLTPVVGAAWSYSALKNLETCAKRYYHYNVEKDVKEEEESEQIKAGHALHKNFENRLIAGTPLPLGYGMFEKILRKIVDAPGKLLGEQKLAITGAFEPSSYFGPRVWFRTVLDAAKVKPDGKMVTIFDWKTGKHKDEETQLQLMAAAVFIHMPSVERVKAALVFVNYESTHQMEFVRSDQAEIWGEILPRIRAVQKARDTKEYPPKPSGLCKRYCAVTSCPYHGKGAR